jgi:hypothetical protein
MTDKLYTLGFESKQDFDSAPIIVDDIISHLQYFGFMGLVPNNV